MTPATTITKKVTLGAIVRRLRAARLLLPQDLADLAGVPVDHVDLLERDFPLPLDSKRKILRELWAIKTGK
ncbi:MAG: hypothetical protein A2137_02440 [Chloroflexi bacterium RBG_16_58_8]|nr:MAG: hypothetical protein A2137_02440 [Chloroflexi bacterium RBG_16_58_8]